MREFKDDPTHFAVDLTLKRKDEKRKEGTRGDESTEREVVLVLASWLACTRGSELGYHKYTTNRSQQSLWLVIFVIAGLYIF